MELSSENLVRKNIDRFWETIPPIWSQLRGNIRSAAGEQYGISVEQFHLLRHIRRGACSISALAEARMTSRPAVSQSIELLVEKGLVTRQPDPTDRRFVLLALTPRGEELIAAVFKKNRAWMAERLSQMEDTQLETLLSALDVLHAAFLPDPDRAP